MEIRRNFTYHPKQGWTVGVLSFAFQPGPFLLDPRFSGICLFQICPCVFGYVLKIRYHYIVGKWLPNRKLTRIFGFKLLIQKNMSNNLYFQLNILAGWRFSSESSNLKLQCHPSGAWHLGWEKLHTLTPPTRQGSISKNHKAALTWWDGWLGGDDGEV